MRFPLRVCACALVLSAQVWAAAASHDPLWPAGACAAPAEWGPGEDVPTAAAVETAAPVARGGGGGSDRAPLVAEEAVVNIPSFGPERAPLLGEAYADALEVLSEDGECSEFFGGRAQAAHVLGRLVGQLRDESMGDPSIGIRMRGSYSTVHDLMTGARFRLFESAAVNRNGPFFRATGRGRELADCGTFAPNTRGARATMLLHELGHLMRGPDGQWLLQNDGHNPMLVARNTARVEKSCGRSIKALGRRDAAADEGGRLTARARR